MNSGLKIIEVYQNANENPCAFAKGKSRRSRLRKAKHWTNGRNFRSAKTAPKSSIELLDDSKTCRPYSSGSVLSAQHSPLENDSLCHLMRKAERHFGTRQIHPFSPVYNSESRLLILGTITSVKSRETGFYYGHSQNRFWKVLATIFNCSIPEGAAEKIDMLLSNNIALWDVLHSCEITGSSDSSIKNPVSNDFSIILQNTKIERVYTNGSIADKLYKTLCEKETGICSVRLPSTSPANAAYSFDRLMEEWKILATVK